MLGKAVRVLGGFVVAQNWGFSLCSAPSQHLGCDQLGLGSSAAALSLGGMAGDPLSHGMALERGYPDVLGFLEGASAFS